MSTRWFDRFQKYFIPHEQNEHEPHFLRERMVAGLLVLLVLIEAAVVIPSFFVLPRNGFLATVLPQAITDLTNQTRLAAAVSALATSPLLTAAAQGKAEDMARRGYFSHQSPEGTPPWVWLDQVGYHYAAAGENLAVNFYDSRDVVDAWQRSPAHEQNLVRPIFSEIGIGVAAGAYQGRSTLYVVQFFGRPSGVNVATNIIPSSPRLNQLLSAAIAATHVSYWQILATRLHTISGRVYLALLALALIAFALNFFVKIKIQHPHIIVNGLLLILVLAGMLFINDQIFTAKLQTSYTEIETANSL